MFFRVAAFKTLLVPPQDLGQKLQHSLLLDMLKAAVEGQHIPYVGRVVAVVDLFLNQVEAKIVDSGDAAIVINYEAIVFKLFKDEYVDVVVSEVTAEGFYATAGPATVYVPKLHMPRYRYGQTGPVTHFEEIETGAKIRESTVVRVRIVAETPGRNSDAMASLDGEFLGVR